MDPHRTALLLAVALGLGSAACGSEGAAPTSFTAEGAWARPTPATATDGVVYVTLTSPRDDVLRGVSVDADVAEQAELHESMASGGSGEHDHGGSSGSGGGTMVMALLASVELDAGEAVVFEPGGKHIMLVGLADPLTAGERFTLTLDLEAAGPTPVQVEVRDSAP